MITLSLLAVQLTTVGSGTIPVSGAPLSTTASVAVSIPINGLTGTINVVIALSGASGNGNVVGKDSSFVVTEYANNNQIDDTLRVIIQTSGTAKATAAICQAAPTIR